MPSYLHRLLQDREDVQQSATKIGHSGAVPTVHQDNNGKARIPLHSTSHLMERAAKDSFCSGQ